MNEGYQQLLKLACPTRTPLTNLTVVPNDLTPVVFDNQYYRDILMGKGLFGVDSSLSRDPRTAAIVHKFAYDKNYFFQAFSSAFVKLSSTNVLTNAKGEVRKNMQPWKQSLSGGPLIKIRFGRKDSTTSSHQQADILLPPAGVSVSRLLSVFRNERRGSSRHDGCTYPRSWALPKHDTGLDPNRLHPYFKHILRGKGLFVSDSSISRDPCTTPIVHKFADDRKY
ncbi:hypothetical protein Patl1_09959 [Pistacia atlantica]|uniref:Uncharacterized protein n=1 Tax=Pistacia atlantica TaxID=434234 RepID=A0ACC1A0K6_9ROSI|nr:hypothetical protein Patl1_09959 [Pistacia atlantica]